MRINKKSLFYILLPLLAACNKDPYMPNGPATQIELSSNSTTYGNNNDADQKLSTIRYMTYNIHAANPPSQPDSTDIKAIAKVITDANPDIVFLQEVDKNTGRNKYSGDQAAAIAGLTKMNYSFFSSISYLRGLYGVAILSKYPLKSIRKYYLPKEQPDHEQRVLGLAVVDLPGVDSLVAAVTHLQHNSATSRVAQINEINSVMAGIKQPVLIGGDMNANPSATDFITAFDAGFTRTCTSGCSNTYSAQSPNTLIDYLAFRPATAFTVNSHNVINETYASDHLPVISELKINR
ncbi:endonuclease/exonuclease/phosphatase family protein [Filimonas effusa]|uniref:Endonuclease/exonuclease/phosphatase family protein n=1 Tax=Filimonas effusa TaxID=2508721 RepID=A0A4V1M9W6_9BACT|nr:endonuclease/exonuclease/phosphatase family protein [Filimonas effusa]RXK83104.1 endonuclease/exonuclease/phosphatase family protein [Filimonas effusa]